MWTRFGSRCPGGVPELRCGLRALPWVGILGNGTPLLVLVLTLYYNIPRKAAVQSLSPLDHVTSVDCSVSGPGGGR